MSEPPKSPGFIRSVKSSLVPQAPPKYELLPSSSYQAHGPALRVLGLGGGHRAMRSCVTRSNEYRGCGHLRIRKVCTTIHIWRHMRLRATLPGAEQQDYIGFDTIFRSYGLTSGWLPDSSLDLAQEIRRISASTPQSVPPRRHAMARAHLTGTTVVSTAAAATATAASAARLNANPRTPLAARCCRRPCPHLPTTLSMATAGRMRDDGAAAMRPGCDHRVERGAAASPRVAPGAAASKPRLCGARRGRRNRQGGGGGGEWGLGWAGEGAATAAQRRVSSPQRTPADNGREDLSATGRLK
eukprot:238229-Chlamydomonas_euryale.AAC.3